MLCILEVRKPPCSVANAFPVLVCCLRLCPSCTISGTQLPGPALVYEVAVIITIICLRIQQVGSKVLLLKNKATMVWQSCNVNHACEQHANATCCHHQFVPVAGDRTVKHCMEATLLRQDWYRLHACCRCSYSAEYKLPRRIYTWLWKH